MLRTKNTREIRHSQRGTAPRLSTFLFFILSLTSLSVPLPEVAPPPPAVNVEPLLNSAQFYYNRNDFTRAYKLWEESFRRQPRRLDLLVKTCELKLLFEGRDGCRLLIKTFLSSPELSLSPVSRDSLASEMLRLESLFMSDEGQSTYLKGMARMKANDCAGANPLFEQAFRLEKGNLFVIKAKAECERQLQYFDKYLETAQFRWEVMPLDPDGLDAYVEALVYHKNYSKVLEVMGKANLVNPTFRQSLAQAVSYSEMGANDAALSLFKDLPSLPKTPKNYSITWPIVWYELGKIYSLQSGHSVLAMEYLRKFIGGQGMTMRDPARKADRWDPYRTEERVAEARKVLETLVKTPADRS